MCVCCMSKLKCSMNWIQTVNMHSLRHLTLKKKMYLTAIYLKLNRKFYSCIFFIFFLKIKCWMIFGSTKPFFNMLCFQSFYWYFEVFLKSRFSTVLQSFLSFLPMASRSHRGGDFYSAASYRCRYLPSKKIIVF